jgi:hypothetical protein
MRVSWDAAMKKLILFTGVVGILAACTANATPTSSPSTLVQSTEVVLPGGYRPVQQNDTIEGAPIGYNFILPSSDQPVVVIAASPYLLHFLSLKPELAAGFVAYVKELGKHQNVLMFDENDPNQTVPKVMSWDAGKPVEIVYLPVPDGKHNWSVTDGDDTVEDAYKIVRRKDGGLRFIDVWQECSLHRWQHRHGQWIWSRADALLAAGFAAIDPVGSQVPARRQRARHQSAIARPVRSESRQARPYEAGVGDESRLALGVTRRTKSWAAGTLNRNALGDNPERILFWQVFEYG